MTELAPVLTGCHVCRSPFVETINKKMRDGVFEEFPEYVIGYKDGEYIFEEVEDAAP